MRERSGEVLVLQSVYERDARVQAAKGGIEDAARMLQRLGIDVGGIAGDEVGKVLGKVPEAKCPLTMNLLHPIGSLVLMLAEPTEKVVMELLDGDAAWSLEHGSVLQPP